MIRDLRPYRGQAWVRLARACAPADADVVVPEAILRAGVPEQLAKKHVAVLEQAVDVVAALHQSTTPVGAELEHAPTPHADAVPVGAAASPLAALYEALLPACEAAAPAAMNKRRLLLVDTLRLVHDRLDTVDPTHRHAVVSAVAGLLQVLRGAPENGDDNPHTLVAAALDATLAFLARAAPRAQAELAVTALPHLVSAALGNARGLPAADLAALVADLGALVAERSPAVADDVRVAFRAAALTQLTNTVSEAAARGAAPGETIAVVRRSLDKRRDTAWGGLSLGLRYFNRGNDDTAALRTEMRDAFLAAAAAEPMPTPSIALALERLRTRLTERPLAGDADDLAEAWRATAALLRASATLPHGGALFGILERSFVALADNADASAKVLRALRGGELKRALGAVLTAEHPDDDALMEAFRARAAPGAALGEDDAVRVVAAAVDAHHVTRAALDVLAHALPLATAGGGRPLTDAELLHVAQVDSTLTLNLFDAPPDADSQAQLRARVALAHVRARMTPAVAERLPAVMRTAERAGLDVTALLDPARGFPLAALLASEPRTVDVADRVVELGAALPGNATRAAHARNSVAAVEILRATCLIYPHGEAAWQRVLADLPHAFGARRMAQPAGRDAVALRAQHPNDLLSRVDVLAAAGVPAELVPSQLVHLSAPMQAFVLAQLAKHPQRSYAYQVRDAVFFCVEHHDDDLAGGALLKALSTSVADDRIVMEVVRRLAQGFRAGGHDGIFPDAFVVALRDNVDVRRAIHRAHPQAPGAEEQAAPRVAPRLPALAARTADPFNAVGHLWQNLLGKVYAGRVVDNTDLGHARTVLEGVERDVRAGVFDETRYAGPVADEVLKDFDAAQRRAWATPVIFGETQLVAPPPTPQMKLAAELVAGLPVALARDYLGAALREDVRQLPRLVAERAERAAQRTRKGSDNHARNQAALADLGGRIAIAELVTRIQGGDAPSSKRDPRGFLLHLQEPLAAAARAARRRQHLGLLVPLLQAQAAVPHQAPVEQIGDRFAMDSHDVDAFLTAYGRDSCISPTLAHNTCNVSALAEFIAGPGYRMLRVAWDGDWHTRQLLRVMRLERRNRGHKGCVLLDHTAAPFDKKYPGTVAENTLAVRCAIQKVVLDMGVPLVSTNPQLAVEAAALELPIDAQDPEVSIARGHTGHHHGETIPQELQFLEFGRHQRLPIFVAGAVVVFPRA